uniref:Leucine-rich repeats and immunoglobulin-like domains protein 3 n=1 Tax=Phallusia mammillata TaxID=59560 RepID=A0A6F9DKI4_9ASCI|nr:leucine-rich repeats and immunoglobulin-like domains protein 3 [Phallusia mammillata]
MKSMYFPRKWFWLSNLPLDRRKSRNEAKRNYRFVDIFLIILFLSSWIICTACAQQPPDCPSQCTCVYSKKLVNCSNRSLKQIPHPIPSWVSILTFRNNKLTENEVKGQLFNNLPHLQELIFSDNRLSRVNLSIRNAPKLRILRFDHCSLSDLPVVSSGTAQNIYTLSLSHNSINDIGKGLQSWTSLHLLDLSFNRLRHLRNNTFINQKNLTELYLHRNKIKVVEPCAFNGLNHTLETLSLSRNRIRLLRGLSSSSIRESCIGFLSNLRYLDLSRNHIAQVDGLTFNGMCRLNTLLLNYNSITTLKDGSFYSLKALERLNLDHNLVSSVSMWLFDLEKLHSLSLHNNNVSEIVQDSWKFSKEIKQLNLSSNKLSLISNGLFRQLRKLEKLDLSNNVIEVMENNAFAGLEKLKTLILARNRISSSVEDIDGAFHGLSALQVLNLNDNKIRSLSADVLRGAENIHTLDLRRNNVTSVQNNTFVDVTNLSSLKMDSASFLCDCQLSWFANWLHEDGNGTFNGETICFHPPSLKGQSVMKVNASLFECGEHPIPALERQPTEQSAHKDENVTLECSAIATLTGGHSEADMSTVDMSVVWRKGSSDDPTSPNEVIKSSKSVRIRNQQRREGGHIFFTSVLLLHKVGYEDERVYSCVISNGFGHATSTPARLEVYALPHITRKPEHQVIKEGSEVIFNCRAVGHPLPEIAWEKDGGMDFPAAVEYRLEHDENEAQGSEYEDGEEDDDIDNKGGLRNVKSSSSDARVSELLHSRARGGGLAADGEKAREKKRQSPANDASRVPLHITKVKPSDAGEYTCIATSDVGKRTASATLTVLYAPVIEPMKKETQATYNSHVVFQCTAHGYPQPDITWYKDGGILNITERHFFAGDNQLLVISGAVESDKGHYECAVSNYLGTMKSETELKLVKRLDDGWDIMGPNGIIIISVFACVIVTSLVWLIVLCYTRKNPEGAPSTQTDLTDCHPGDSSSHDSLDRPNRLPPVCSNLPRQDMGGRYIDPPDILPQSSACRPQFHPSLYHSNPRMRADDFPVHSAVNCYQRQSSSRTDACDSIICGRDSLPRPPLRALSTSHMHRLQVESHAAKPPPFSSTQCIATRSSRAQSEPRRPRHPHPKRRRKRRRQYEAGEQAENGSARTFSSSSDSDTGDERNSLMGGRTRGLPNPSVWQKRTRVPSRPRTPSAAETESLLRVSTHGRHTSLQSTVSGERPPVIEATNPSNATGVQ